VMGACRVRLLSGADVLVIYWSVPDHFPARRGGKEISGTPSELRVRRFITAGHVVEWVLNPHSGWQLDQKPTAECGIELLICSQRPAASRSAVEFVGAEKASLPA